MNNNKEFGVVLMMLLLLVSGFMEFPAAAARVLAGEERDWFMELMSREEMVRMAGYGEEKLSTVLVTGSLHCDSPIPGALVGVNCHSHDSERKGKSTRVAKGVTDEFGDFIIDLPSYLHAIPNLEKVCTVKVHYIPKDSQCKPAYGKRHNNKLTLSSFGNGIRTYTAGNLRFN